MNKTTWKTLYRRLRADKRNGSTFVYEGQQIMWKVHFFKDGSDAGLHIEPAIIRDRSPTARQADALYWAKRYRLEAKTHKANGSYWVIRAGRSVAGAKACIQECRDIRANASIFQAIA